MSEVDYLLSPKAIRDSAAKVYDLTTSDKGHFSINPDRLQFTVDYVLETIRQNYPTLDIPFHSRWGHFRPGGVDRSKWLAEKIQDLDPIEQARVKFDLVIPSVLLDAGTGGKWKYDETQTKGSFDRSEGLGVASFHMFMAGAFSGDHSLSADAAGLKKVSAADIEKYFQVTSSNPLVGTAGRATLLQNLGEAVQNKKFFETPRPGALVDLLIHRHGQTIPAPGILRAVLDGLGPIWPSRLSLDGVPLGDIWRHSTLGLMAFHKLSQWMTYSLIEPLLDAGLIVTGVEDLTGLAEYRNGGLLLDSGLLNFKNPADASKAWRPESDLVIEWRALTIHYLDVIGLKVQKALDKSPSDFPLAKVLEGGTWWAGRRIAKEKRPGGGPPIQIDSDGTVF